MLLRYIDIVFCHQKDKIWLNYFLVLSSNFHPTQYHMSNEKIIIRARIEKALEKSEQYHTIIELFANDHDLDIFSVGKIVYVNVDSCLFRLDHMLTEDCSMDRKEIKRYLHKFIHDDYRQLNLSDVLDYCYE